MCIPIELDVPVVTVDYREIGIAREIICPCPGDGQAEPAHGSHPDRVVSISDDLWLRATRLTGPDLYIPFVEIADTRPDGVRLRIDSGQLACHDWERVPPGLPVPEAPARVGAA